jgi:hypothetical protein
MLNRRCDKSHDHTPCAGQNTLLTQGYTAEITDIVHQSIVRDIATANKQTAQCLAVGAAEGVCGGPRPACDKPNVNPGTVLSYSGRSLLFIGIDEMQENDALAAL